MEKRGEKTLNKRNKPAAKLGEIHEHSICSLGLQRSIKLPRRD